MNFGERSCSGVVLHQGTEDPMETPLRTHKPLNLGEKLFIWEPTRSPEPIGLSLGRQPRYGPEV